MKAGNFALAESKYRSDAIGQARVLVVANRLPITAVKEAGVLRIERSNGGLVSGLLQVARNWPLVWYGWNGMASDETEMRESERWEGGSLIAVPLSDSDINLFYRQYCNCVLWPMLHGFTDNVVAKRHDWQRYVDVNQRYADAILRDARPNDRVWVHDYHLFLVPELLRRRNPALPIAFFLHTPLPPLNVLQTVPHYRELMRGVLSADVVGFHTTEYMRAFLDAARHLGFAVSGDTVLVDNRIVRVKARPMGIDGDAFARLATDPQILQDVESIKSGDRRLMLGVDRLDYTKGIPERLLAFELMLQEHGELRGQVTFMQVAVPSRGDIAAYQDLRDVVESIVARINRRFGTGGWEPVEYLYDTVDLNTLVSLYRAADVLVVTAHRDGLNLVAKEFVATRADGDGVLILSKFAGAAAELRAALQVDPNQVREIADAYRRALAMSPAERRVRMRQLRSAIAPNNVITWAREFLEGLPVVKPA
jgi:trehalose 6-phosphate synthase/phosphatase